MASPSSCAIKFLIPISNKAKKLMCLAVVAEQRNNVVKIVELLKLLHTTQLTKRFQLCSGSLIKAHIRPHRTFRRIYHTVCFKRDY